MPIPILAPILLTLGLAAASEGQDEGDWDWDLDIDDHAFDRVNGNTIRAIVVVDLDERRAEVSLSFMGRSASAGPDSIKFWVDRSYPGGEVRSFLHGSVDLEKMRSQLKNGEIDISVARERLQDEWDAEKGNLVERCSPREYLDDVSDIWSKGDMVQQMLEYRTKFFDDSQFQVVGSEEEKKAAILFFVKDWFYHHEKVVDRVEPIPEETVELRRLLGSPHLGFRFVLEQEAEPADLDVGVFRFQDRLDTEDAINLEPVGIDEQGRQIWDLFLF